MKHQQWLFLSLKDTFNTALKWTGMDFCSPTHHVHQVECVSLEACEKSLVTRGMAAAMVLHAHILAPIWQECMIKEIPNFV